MSRLGHHINKLDGVVVFPPSVGFLVGVKRPLEFEEGKLKMIYSFLNEKFKICLLGHFNNTKAQTFLALEIRVRLELTVAKLSSHKIGLVSNKAYLRLLGRSPS